MRSVKYCCNLSGCLFKVTLWPREVFERGISDLLGVIWVAGQGLPAGKAGAGTA